MKSFFLLFVLVTTEAGLAFTTLSNSNNKHSGIGSINQRLVRVATETASETMVSSEPRCANAPKLIVFDLDNTVWTPELYQLRKLQRNNRFPVANKDVKLYPPIQTIVERKNKNNNTNNTKFAIASRTKSVEWAHDLLDQFGIKEFFDYIEIFPGDKKRHFANLKKDSGIDYEDMLFFDDARDGKYGNCVPVSSLGVLSVHCPNGIYEESVWNTALEKYEEWASSSGTNEGGNQTRTRKQPNTIVEWDGSVTTTTTTKGGNSNIDPGQRFRGTIKYINRQKRFGFIRYGDRKTKDMFFHFSALPCVDSVVEEGDELVFSVVTDPRKGKDAASDIEIVSSSTSTTESSSNDPDDNTVTMRVFSMNLPFAALLSNGYKTLETRNGTMFVPYEEGTKMLLHVGQRTYPDGNRHLEVMKSGGLDDRQINDLKSLPKGFGKGMAVAIVELGRTFETTLEERCDPDFQRSVGAFGADSGRRATEIKRVEYLKQGVKVSGSGGVFRAKIDKDVIPDGWLDDDDDDDE